MPYRFFLFQYFKHSLWTIFANSNMFQGMNIESYIVFANYYYRKAIRIYFRYVAGVLLLLMIGFGIFRACSSTTEEDNGLYHIARDPNWNPLQLFDKEKNMSAFTNELLFEIARREKIHLELLRATSDDLLDGLKDGNYDGILSSIRPGAINRDLYEFSDPIYLLGPVLIVRSSSNIASLSDLQYKVLGVRQVSSNPELQTFADISIRNYENVLSALMDLDRGLIDAVLMESLPAYQYLLGIFNGKLKIVSKPMTDLGIRLVARHDGKSETRLIHRFNEGLKAVKADGTYDALLTKWGLPKIG